MPKNNENHRISFKNALAGLGFAFRTQRNFRLMIILAVLVLGASLILGLSLVETAILIWTIFVVLVAEMVNTALESVTNLVTQEWRQEAKIAKDISSGMVLLSVISSIIIGILIFGPKLLFLISNI